MPVEAQTVEYVYLGDGVTKTFSFPSKFTSSNDIVVGLDGQSQPGGYTVAGAAAETGGSVTFITAPAAGVRVSLLRKPAASQLLDFVNGQTILEGLLDGGLDKLTMITQYLLRGLQKSVRLSEFDGASVTPLPFAADRANKLLAFDSNGDVTTAASFGDLAAVPLASQAEAQAGTDNSKMMTPLRVAQVAQETLAKAGQVAQEILAKAGNALYVDVRAYGAKLDGVTDDTAAINAAIAAIGAGYASMFIAGPAKISANVTFGVNTWVVFSAAGKIVGTAGTEQVYFQRPVSAPDTQIVSTVVPLTSVSMTVFPEWFGAKGDDATDDRAAIQAAVDFIKYVGGTVQLGPKWYRISSNINIGINAAGSTGANTIFRGSGQTLTRLRVTAAAAGGVQVLGYPGHALQGVRLEHFTIDKTVISTGGVGIYCQYTALAKINDITIYGMLYGVSLLRAGNTLANRVIVVFTGTQAGGHGFDLNGGGTGAGGNASCVFTDCLVDASGYTGASVTGFSAYGAYVSDLLFVACETQRCTVGFSFDCTTSAAAGNEDVQLYNCRCDSILDYGIYVNGAGTSGDANSMIHIIGGWMNPLSTLAVTRGVYVVNSRGVVIRDVQFLGIANYAYVRHVEFSGATNCMVLGCVFSDMNYGVYSVGGSYNVVANNRFFANSGRAAANMVAFVGDVRTSISANIFDGYAAIAVYVDNTSTGTLVVSNTANPVNIGTSYSNSAVSGQTSLNAGA